jgi:hypothetical protein
MHASTHACTHMRARRLTLTRQVCVPCRADALAGQTRGPSTEAHTKARSVPAHPSHANRMTADGDGRRRWPTAMADDRCSVACIRSSSSHRHTSRDESVTGVTPGFPSGSPRRGCHSLATRTRAAGVRSCGRRAVRLSRACMRILWPTGWRRRTGTCAPSESRPVAIGLIVEPSSPRCHRTILCAPCPAVRSLWLGYRAVRTRPLGGLRPSGGVLARTQPQKTSVTVPLSVPESQARKSLEILGMRSTAARARKALGAACSSCAMRLAGT